MRHEIKVEFWRRKAKAEGDKQVVVFGTDRNKKIDKVAYVPDGDAMVADYVAKGIADLIDGTATCPEDIEQSVVVVADGLTIKKLEYPTYYDDLSATHDRVDAVEFVCA